MNIGCHWITLCPVRDMEMLGEEKLMVQLPDRCVHADTTQCKLPTPQPSLSDSPYFDAYTPAEPVVCKIPGRPCTATSVVEDDRPESSLTSTVSCSPTTSSVSSLTSSLSVYDTSMEGGRDKPPMLIKSNSCDSETDLFECGICTEDLKVPKSLPCLHNFCQDCLQKYFSANNLMEGKPFLCPTCRAPVSIPQGGAKQFPTNFHILNLRKRSRDLDMGQTIKEAVHYLESRAEEIVDELTETKRQVLIEISKRRSDLITRIENLAETSLESIEVQHVADSTRSVEVINTIKTKLSQLQAELGTTFPDRKSDKPKNAEAIKLNALTKLRRQAEIISNVNNELEELKSEADHSLSSILASQIAFCPGSCSREELKQSFGKLVILTDGQTIEQVKSQESSEEGFSPLHVKSWSQSWWVLVFAVLPAVICAMVVRLIMSFFDKILG